MRSRALASYRPGVRGRGHGRLVGAEGSMYLLSAVTNCPDIACLTDYPATAGALGLLGGVTGIAGAVIVGVA